MALQQLKSAPFSGYIPFSVSPSGDVDFGSSNIQTGGDIAAGGRISAGGCISAANAIIGSSGIEVQINCGDIYADGNIEADGIAANYASFGSSGEATIDNSGNIDARNLFGHHLLISDTGVNLLDVVAASGSRKYHSFIRLTSGSVVKSGYICPDSQGVLHLESSLPY